MCWLSPVRAAWHGRQRGAKYCWKVRLRAVPPAVDAWRSRGRVPAVPLARAPHATLRPVRRRLPGRVWPDASAMLAPATSRSPRCLAWRRHGRVPGPGPPRQRQRGPRLLRASGRRGRYCCCWRSVQTNAARRRSSCRKHAGAGSLLRREANASAGFELRAGERAGRFHPATHGTHRGEDATGSNASLPVSVPLQSHDCAHANCLRHSRQPSTASTV